MPKQLAEKSAPPEESGRTSRIVIKAVMAANRRAALTESTSGFSKMAQGSTFGWP
jgi:hypothetical protein